LFLTLSFFRYNGHLVGWLFQPTFFVFMNPSINFFCRQRFEKSLHNFKENIYNLRQKHIYESGLQSTENQLVIK